MMTSRNAGRANPNLRPRTRLTAEFASHAPHGSVAALMIAATGIVFGGIGTSPLYALDQIFLGHGGIPLTHENVLGGISLVIWALTVIVAITYGIFMLRAQNDGEGGVFALYGLLHRYKNRGIMIFLWSLMLGAGLLFGDGIITPAISVLAAVEGLGVAAPSLGGAVIPITVLLLTALFAVQIKGTSGIGRVFGPILVVWFIVLAILGAHQIVHHSEILQAFNPVHGLMFLMRVGLYKALLVLGALILVVAGGEAMYADLGHFGALPIRTSWFTLVYPALLLNYLGQGAYLLSGAPIAGGKIFYSLVPPALLYPIILLATAATVIASQALISGAFSLALQATALGLLPRLQVRHTHHSHAGQIYVPFINWSLYVGCIVVVITFGSSYALGAAYGLAVSGVMLMTSLAMFPVSMLCWGWGTVATGLLWGTLTMINGSFLLANSFKFLEGGFVPLSIGMAVFVIMVTWRWGRKATFAAYSAKETMTITELIRLHRSSRIFMERTAVLMTPKPLRDKSDRTPALLQLLWDRYGVLPRNLIFVEVTHRKVPFIHDDRYVVTVFDKQKDTGSIISVELSFGFMEEPNVERALEGMARLREIDLPIDRRQWIVHVSNENLLPARSMGLIQRLRFRLFILLRLVSRPAYYHYGLGDEVQLSAETLPVRIR
jgi:KUP system potassium uptake protein